jgi:hypothetical protein
MHYTLQYIDTLTFLQASTLLLVYTTSDPLHHEITSFTRLFLLLMILSTASLQSPGLPHTTGSNPFAMPGFFASLAGVTKLTPLAPIATAPSSGYKNFHQRLILNCTSTTILLLDLHGPLRFSTIILCLPCTILSCTGSERDGFSVNSPDPKGSIILRNEL